MINVTIDFCTHLLLVLSMLIFDVRRYNDSYLSCAYVPRPMKSVEKS